MPAMDACRPAERVASHRARTISTYGADRQVPRVLSRPRATQSASASSSGSRCTVSE